MSRHRTTGHGGGVGFLTRTVDVPTCSTFENIAISVVTLSKSFVVSSVYRTPGSCSSAFLDDFLFLPHSPYGLSWYFFSPMVSG